MAQRAHVRQTPQWDQRNGNEALRCDALGLRLQRVCAGVLDWCNFATPRHHITTTPQNPNAKTQPQVKKLNATMPQHKDNTHAQQRSNATKPTDQTTQQRCNNKSEKTHKPTTPQIHSRVKPSRVSLSGCVLGCAKHYCATKPVPHRPIKTTSRQHHNTTGPKHTRIATRHCQDTSTQRDARASCINAHVGGATRVSTRDKP